jgi:uncharacterized protein
MALGLAIYAMRGYSLRELGFRLDSLGTSLTMNIILSATVIAALGVAYSRGFFHARAVPGWTLFLPLYVGLFCPAQEFCCRSIIFSELDRLAICPATAQVLVSAVTYSFIHIIYAKALILSLTFAIGVAWGAIYRIKPNFYGVTLSHALIGGTSIFVGLS